MRVVVGLGNPGKQYAGTRHNVGFDVIDALASAPGAGRFLSKFAAQVAEVMEGGEKILLAKPETFMNLSGRAVRQVMDFYQIEPAQLLVVCDDVSLPLGKLRARAKGTHGGHNGLRDIQSHLGTVEYARLRIGVGGAEGDGLSDHVLGRFKPSEKPLIEDARIRAAQAVFAWVQTGIEETMNRFQRRPRVGQEVRPIGMPANVYECMFILDTNKVAGDEAGITRTLHGLLERNHAEVMSTRKWGEPKLAYQIGSHKKGLYLLMYFRSEGKNIEPLETDFRLNETVIRYMVTKIDPKHVAKMLECGNEGGPNFFPTVTEVSLDEAALAGLGGPGLPPGMGGGDMGGGDDRRGGTLARPSPRVRRQGRLSGTSGRG